MTCIVSLTMTYYYEKSIARHRQTGRQYKQRYLTCYGLYAKSIARGYPAMARIFDALVLFCQKALQVTDAAHCKGYCKCRIVAQKVLHTPKCIRDKYV